MRQCTGLWEMLCQIGGVAMGKAEGSKGWRGDRGEGIPIADPLEQSWEGDGLAGASRLGSGGVGSSKDVEVLSLVAGT